MKKIIIIPAAILILLILLFVCYMKSQIKRSAYPYNQQNPVPELHVGNNDNNNLSPKDAALCEAVEKDNFKQVKRALKNGANPNCLCLPLKKAIEKENHGIIEILLQYGATPNIQIATGCVDDCDLPLPIVDAVVSKAASDNFEPLKILLSNKDALMRSGIYEGNNLTMFPDKKSNDMPSWSRDLVAKFQNDKQFLEYLFSKGIKPTFYGINNVETAKYMLSKGADINEIANCSWTGHCVRIIDKNFASNNIEMIEFLIENGAEMPENSKLVRSLWYNLRADKIEAAKYVLDKMGNEKYKLLEDELKEDMDGDFFTPIPTIDFLEKYIIENNVKTPKAYDFKSLLNTISIYKTKEAKPVLITMPIL